MNATLSRSSDVPAAIRPKTRVDGFKRVLGLLSAVAYAAAERLTLPQRDLPPEFYRFPPL